MGVCVDKPVEWQDELCQMQTESQVSSVSAFRLLNPLSASLFASVTLSRSPSPSLFFSCPLSSSLTLIIWLSTSSLLLHGKYFSPMSLSSCASSLLFPFASVHSLFFADAQRVTIPALRQAVNRESERKRFRDCGGGKRAPGIQKKCRQRLCGGALLFRCSCSSCSRCVCSTSRHQPTAQSHALVESPLHLVLFFLFPLFVHLFALMVSSY